MAQLLEYRTVQKALTSYGQNMIELINPATGRLHADFRQIGDLGRGVARDAQRELGPSPSWVACQPARDRRR